MWGRLFGSESKKNFGKSWAAKRGDTVREDRSVVVNDGPEKASCGGGAQGLGVLLTGQSVLAWCPIQETEVKGRHQTSATKKVAVKPRQRVLLTEVTLSGRGVPFGGRLFFPAA